MTGDGPKARSENLVPQILRYAAEFVLWLAVVGSLAAVVIPAFSTVPSSAPPDPIRALTAILGPALWVYLLAKLKKWPRAWSLALLAVAISSLCYFMRPRSESSVSTVADNVATFDPETAEAIRAASSQQEMLGLLQTAMRGALLRAPDTAVLETHETFLRILLPESGPNMSRCAGILRGIPTTEALSPEEAEMQRTALERLIAAAATQQAQIVKQDDAVAEELLGSIATEVEPADVMGNPEKIASLSDGQLCQWYLDISRKIRALPTDKAALVVRRVMTNAG